MALTQIQTGMLADLAVTDAKIAGVAASKVSGQLADANMSAGSIIQVIQTYNRSGHTATSSSSYVTTGLATSITPLNTSNKILVVCQINFSADTDTYGQFALYRNGSEIVNARSGTASGNRQNAFVAVSMRDGDSPYETELKTAMFIDEPNSVSAQTYELYYKKSYGGAIYLGRPVQDSDSTFIVQAPWAMTLMEIAS